MRYYVKIGLVFNFESLLGQYGYIAVFVGALFEGELIVSLAGALSYQKILHPGKVILISGLATMVSEQICFYIGRYLGSKYVNENWPKAQKVLGLVKKYQVLFILGCRFLYGLRTVSPFIIGSAKIDPVKFTIYNAVAAFMWSTISVGIGYFGAYAADSLGYSHIASYMITGVVVLASIAIVGVIVRHVVFNNDK